MWIHLQPYAISYLLFDTSNSKVLDIDAVIINKNFDNIRYDEVLSKIFSNENEYFKLSFVKVSIAFSTNQFMLLPEQTENPSRMMDFLGMHTLPMDKILSEKISDEQFLYYVLPIDVYNFFIHRFKNVVWHFGDLALLKYSNSKLSFQKHLLAHIAGNDLTIVLKDKNKVSYFNKFYVQDKQDLLYFLKLAYETLDLDTNQFATYLCGFIEEKSPMYTFSYSYIRNFEIDRILHHDLGYSFYYTNDPLHYYYNLLCLGKYEN